MENKLNVTMVGDKILVLQSEGEKEIAGLEIARGFQDKPKKGIVKAIGKDVSICQVGDEVIYQEFAQGKCEIDEVEYMVLKEMDLYLILNR